MDLNSKEYKGMYKKVCREIEDDRIYSSDAYFYRIYGVQRGIHVPLKNIDEIIVKRMEEESMMSDKKYHRELDKIAGVGTIPQGQGVKHDQGKVPLDLIPRSALELEAEVLAFGAKKYDRHNWRAGMDWNRLIAAAMRHIVAFNSGEDKDSESGIHHLAHARCCLGFLIEYSEKGLGNDDRYKPTK